ARRRRAALRGTRLYAARGRRRHAASCGCREGAPRAAASAARAVKRVTALVRPRRRAGRVDPWHRRLRSCFLRQGWSCFQSAPPSWKCKQQRGGVESWFRGLFYRRDDVQENPAADGRFRALAEGREGGRRLREVDRGP